MTTGLGSPFFVIPNQVLKQVQDLRISGSRVLVLRIWVLEPRPVGGALYYYQEKIRISKISEEIFDYADYESITQILNALNIRKICLITFLKSV